MKILHTVESYFPSVGGMQEVVKQLSERLVKMGHDVTVATRKSPDRKGRVVDGVAIEEFDVSGNYTHGLKGEMEEYRNFLLNSKFDIVTNFAAQQWATDAALPIIEKINGKKVFVPTGFSGFYLSEYEDYFEKMKIWMKKYDMNVFLSDDYRDVNFAKENGIEKRILIPNGAGEDEFLKEDNVDIKEKLGIPEDHFLILHVGSHTGQKGHGEAIEIFKKAKIKNTTFLMIANSFGYGCTYSCFVRGKTFRRSIRRFLDHKKLIIKSLTRRETVAAYKAADLFLFPSNIECSPIVLFECMASRTPFLTSDVGNAKEIIKWSQGGILLPSLKNEKGGNCSVDIEKSVKMLEDIYGNKIKRQEMRERGFDAWKEKFSWEKIAKNYESLYRDLVSNK